MGADTGSLHHLDSPLHVDPGFAKMGGFKVPILHGLCFMGFAAKAVYEKYVSSRPILFFLLQCDLSD